MSGITAKDAKDLRFITRDQAVDVVIRLMDERDACVNALYLYLKAGVGNSTCFELQFQAEQLARDAIAKATGAA
jgi:hypothetical protein